MKGYQHNFGSRNLISMLLLLLVPLLYIPPGGCLRGCCSPAEAIAIRGSSHQKLLFWALSSWKKLSIDLFRQNWTRTTLRLSELPSTEPLLQLCGANHSLYHFCKSAMVPPDLSCSFDAASKRWSNFPEDCFHTVLYLCLQDYVH